MNKERVTIFNVNFVVIDIFVSIHNEKNLPTRRFLLSHR